MSFAFVDSIIVDEDEAENSLRLPILSTMFACFVETTTLLKRKKNLLRQIENCCNKKTKSYATIYNSQDVATRERLFSFAVRDALNNIACRRKYDANKRKKKACICVKIRQKKKQLL